MTPYDTLRDALRAWRILQRENLDMRKRTAELQARIDAFAEWEKAPAPARSRLRKAAQATYAADRRTVGAKEWAPIIRASGAQVD